jgi:hypothetical protein
MAVLSATYIRVWSVGSQVQWNINIKYVDYGGFNSEQSQNTMCLNSQVLSTP